MIEVGLSSKHATMDWRSSLWIEWMEAVHSSTKPHIHITIGTYSPYYMLTPNDFKKNNQTLVKTQTYHPLLNSRNWRKKNNTTLKIKYLNVRNPETKH